MIRFAASLAWVLRRDDDLLGLLDDLVVVAQDVFEHVSADLEGERGRDVANELVQFLLLGHGDHNGLEVLTDILSQVLG